MNPAETLSIVNTGAVNIPRNSSSESEKKEFFDSLVEMISGDLYKYAYWACQNRQVAEDVVQETFLKVWKNIHQLRDPDSAKGWIFTIFRREHARLFTKQTAVIIPIDDVMEKYLPTTDGNNISNHFLYNALNSIQAEYSEPLLLQVLGGFTCDEIAIILDISRSNVLTRVFRARKKMQKLLSNKCGDRYEMREDFNQVANKQTP